LLLDASSSRLLGSGEVLIAGRARGWWSCGRESRFHMSDNRRALSAGPRRIRLSLPDSGASAVADLLDDDCPDTCSALWDLLPLRLKAHHDIWSGHLIRCHLEGDPYVDPENVLTYIPVPGDVFYYHRSAHYYRGTPYGRLVSAEIGIVYDRDTRPQGPRGPEAVNLFAEISSGLEELSRACEAMIYEGQRELVIERMDDT